MTETSNSNDISTRLDQIAKLAKASPGMVITTLAHHIDIDWLREAFRRTRKDGARGVDGRSAAEYEANLEANLHGPDERYREVTVSATIKLIDGDCFAKDAHAEVDCFRVCTVGPNPGEQERDLKTMKADELCASEVGGQIEGTCTWQPDGSVEVSLTARLYEEGADTCGGGEEEGNKSRTFVVPPTGEPFDPDKDFEIENEYLCAYLSYQSDYLKVRTLRAVNAVAP